MSRRFVSAFWDMVRSFFRCKGLVVLWLLLLTGVVTCEWMYRHINAREHQQTFFREQLMREVYALDVRTRQVADQLTSSKEEIWRLMLDNGDLPYQFVVYSDTVALAWSAQRVSVEGSDLTDFEVSPVRLANGWYLSSVVRRGNLAIVGLLLLKSEYPYQNPYLVNHFNPVFRLGDGYDISFDRSSGGMEMRSHEGKYLFSLIDRVGHAHISWIARVGAIFLLLWLVVGGVLMVFIIRNSVYRGRWLLVIFGLGFLIYYLFFVSGVYTGLSNVSLFSPVWFAYSAWFASVGSLGIAVMLGVFFVWCSCFFFRWPRSLVRHRIWLRVFAWLLLMGMLWLMNWVMQVLVDHSPDVFMFMHLSDFGAVSVVKMGIVFMLMLGFTLFGYRLMPLLFYRRRLFPFVVSVVASALLYQILQVTAGRFNHWDASLFMVLMIGTIGWMYHRRMVSFTFRHLVWLLLIADIFAVVRIYHFNGVKEQSNRLFLIDMLAGNMTGEQDAVAEMYLSDMEERIATDGNIRGMIAEGDIFDEELKQYLIKNYFYGYLGRYDIQVVPCWPGAELYVDGSDQTVDCYRYFSDMLLQFGDSISGCRHFYLLKKDNGQVNYFGMFDYFKGQPGLELSVYVELTSKPYFEGPGYPELLLSDKDRVRFDLMKGYSYAGYVNGKLVKRSGNYLYDLKLLSDSLVQGDKQWTYTGGYSHLTYAYRQGAAVIISCPQITLSNLLFAFSLFFVVFWILATVLIALNRLMHRSAEPYSIRQRIQISMISFMVILLMVVGVSTVLYTSWQFRRKNSDMLSQRLKSVMLGMEQKVGSESALTDDMAGYLNYLLQNFSNVFYSDINLYGLDGQLLATSRPELYRRGIIGNLMDPNAYESLKYRGVREFVHQESIGGLMFTSAYVPLLNQRNEVLAYLNLPYFVGSNELRDEISSILVAIINAYLVFVLLAIGMALIASRQITRPLSLIRHRLSQTRLGLKNEKIVYAGTDEIGHLVDTYNRMVDELALSAEKLARSERELAWREMAKQVAHEIKNPLTPMQLSVQYLQKAWRDQVPDFDSFIQRVTRTLIEQIQQLSVIANEFSHFAKMPVARREPIALVDKLMNTVSLYQQSSDVTIRVDVKVDAGVKVLMDGEQLLSVFNNLIKNGIQAIPEGRAGVIDITVKREGAQLVMSFRDNGKGIPESLREKMFTPNFTTKTSGMGLGLAIVKNIVESSGGGIHYETEVGSGTVFYVRVPVFDDMS
ncbi:phospho-acceptor domain-containing protein [Breznakibacter xylanolyticus]|uniref:histidine kinase n=1 Tax=Breznakibacter xylanolyticus TaxID=990 RepID=A0A2W7NIB0_9BACT|nr:HAMP domain-containing sensor histidine kinase [Breznakibacter xylanolyticus]PZX19183.1 phospho-acceptor domain-containing protein [Breznakibacter xylanolyticus]